MSYRMIVAIKNGTEQRSTSRQVKKYALKCTDLFCIHSNDNIRFFVLPLIAVSMEKSKIAHNEVNESMEEDGTIFCRIKSFSNFDMESDSHQINYPIFIYFNSCMRARKEKRSIKSSLLQRYVHCMKKKKIHEMSLNVL